MAEIQMPQLGETVTEGTITKWLKSVGDEIAEDEAIVEVSTDKVDSEIPSPVSGTLTEIKVEEGETVDVGTVLALVGDGAAAPTDGAAAPTDGGDGSTEGAGAEEQAQASAGSEVEASGAPEDQGAEAEAKEAEAEAELDAATEPESGAAEEGAPEPSGGDEEPAPSAAPASSGNGEGQVLSPVVRRLIAEHGLDASSITGTGAGGRITRSDVQGAIESGGATPAPAPAKQEPAPAEPRPAPSERPAAAATPTPAARPAPARAGEGDEAVPLNNIRRRTAEHMVRSVATSPHAYASMEVDMEGVERVRRTQKQRYRDEMGISLTYLPFVTRALVDAVAEFPHVNASVGEGELVVHHDVNVGYAVDLDYEGLIVPVVHEAQDLRLPAIARAVADLAERARNRRLSADEITGGTVTITNAGSTGTLVLLPIINQPQVMILSTDGVHRRPVVVTDDEGRESIAIRSVGNLTLGWDHRAFDGAYATAFLRRVVDILETRDWEAEL